MARGKFIVFEGIDGSGKSTHCNLLAEKLKSRGVPVHFTCEPSEGEAGKLLRKCLRGEIDMDEKAIAGLFMTDRLDHILNPVSGLIAHLEKGETVLCDRYYFSSFAYNSMHSPMPWVMQINSQARELLKADLTVFLDIKPEIFETRINSRTAKERYEKLEVLKAARGNYMKAFELLGDERVVIVDNNVPLAEAEAKVWQAVQEIL